MKLSTPIKAIANELAIKAQIFVDKRRFDNQLTESSWGRFRVDYRDGNSTRPMGFHNATAYRNLFGGTVVHSKTGRVVTPDSRH